MFFLGGILVLLLALVCFFLKDHWHSVTFFFFGGGRGNCRGVTLWWGEMGDCEKTPRLIFPELSLEAVLPPPFS